jgi:6-phosphofructokinase 1
MDENAKKGKRAGVIVAAEGHGDSNKLAQEMQQQTTSEVRLSIIGYAQRGGSPTARSRLLASLFAERAVELICEEKGNMAVGLQKGAVANIEFEKAATTENIWICGVESKCYRSGCVFCFRFSIAGNRRF